jgi:integrase
LWNLAQHDFEIDPRAKNPVAGAMTFRTEGRQRLVTAEEMPRLLEALTKLETERPNHAACLWTIFLTGARVSEILYAKTHELQGNRLVKTAHKTAKRTGVKTIALPRPIVQLLERLPVYPDRLFGDIDLKRVWNRLRREIDCPDLQLLDARRTFLSYGLSDGVTLDALAKQAGHTQAVTTAKYYAHLLEDTKDSIADRVASAMLSLKPRRPAAPLKGRFRLRRR